MSAFVINSYAFGVFDPASVSGLQLWLNAEVGLFDATTGGSAVTADAGAVARWEDQSGNGNHVTQATGANQPELKTAIQNGRNVVRFTAANSDQMNAAAAPFAGTTARTFFLVVKAANTGTVSLYGMGSSADTPATGINFDITPEIRARVSGRQDFNLSMGTTAFRLLTIRFPSGGNIGDMVGRLDGTAMSGTPTTVAAINTNSTVGFRIGRAAQVNVGHCGGDYCEFLGYNTELSNTDTQAVETYLANRWGITI